MRVRDFIRARSQFGNMVDFDIMEAIEAADAAIETETGCDSSLLPYDAELGPKAKKAVELLRIVCTGALY